MYVLYWTRVGRGVVETGGGGQRGLLGVRTSNRYAVGVKEGRGVHCKVTVLLYSVLKDPERNERCASIESETGDRD